MNNPFEAWLCGRTVRKHTMHVHRRENTAEHTWGMLMLLIKYVPHASADLMRFIVQHDAGEQGACDVPLHVCLEMPELKRQVQKREDEHVAKVLQGPHSAVHHALELKRQELFTVEILDRAEFIISCWYEFKLGNTMVVNPIKRAVDKLASTLRQMDEKDSLTHNLNILYTDLIRLLKPLDYGAHDE